MYKVWTTYGEYSKRTWLVINTATHTIHSAWLSKTEADVLARGLNAIHTRLHRSS